LPSPLIIFSPWRLTEQDRIIIEQLHPQPYYRAPINQTDHQVKLQEQNLSPFYLAGKQNSDLNQ
jgi:hypothetical protein